MTDDDVRMLLERAVARLTREDATLLALDVSEPAIAHHLSKYIELEVPQSFSVDVEYNKHGTERKVLLLPPRISPTHPAQSTLVRPDVVVHSRGNDASNLLVVEVKKPGKDLRRDRQKLEAFRQQYGYRNAAHVVVGLFKGTLTSEIRWVV